MLRRSMLVWLCLFTSLSATELPRTPYRSVTVIGKADGWAATKEDLQRSLVRSAMLDVFAQLAAYEAIAPMEFSYIYTIDEVDRRVVESVSYPGRWEGSLTIKVLVGCNQAYTPEHFQSYLKQEVKPPRSAGKR